MRIENLRQRLADLGAKPVHVQRMLRAWLHALPLDAGPTRRGPALPKAVVDALPALTAELAGLARVRSEHPGEDGSARLLVELADGQTVESVLLPRDGLCVSSQVGCAVGCTFCMTGRDGLLRQLTSAEILAQVVLARARRPVKKVVFMGMGEPWSDFPGGSVEADTRRMNACIEDAVRTMPAQYYWVHRRFKTRPPGEPKLY